MQERRACGSGAYLLRPLPVMPIRIVDIDLDAPLPPAVELGEYAAAWLVGFRQGVPLGSELLSPGPGENRIRRADLEAFAARMPASADLPPLPHAGAAVPRVTVIVCTRDRSDRLPVVLGSLRGQSSTDFELVVVDNAPSDGRTRTVVQSIWPSAIYVVEPVPGLPRARNAGIRAAGGDVLAFTDDDCQVVPVWIETFQRAFVSDPALGCVTGPILPMELETPAQEAMEARGGFNRGWRRTRYTLAEAAGPVHPVQAWRFGAGGTFALSRACADRLGGFDEALWKSEDLDAFYRTLRAGFALSFEPGAAVKHRHLAGWSQLSRRLFDWGWGYLAYLDKIAREDTPEFAARARLERSNWLRWQLRARAAAALRGRADLPLGLVMREIAGGLVGGRGYRLARAAADRRAARHGSRAVTPGPVGA